MTGCPVLKPSSSSHFYAAVSDGTLLLRDTAKQVQDITTLSRDVEHANNALSPIFNKEKEQKRLKQAQLIGEIGAQVMDIVRTEGELKAQKAAEAKGDAKVKRPQDGDSVAMWEDYKKALTESPTYKAEMQKYGTGSDFQRAAQAATAAIQALAGGDIQKAIASGASPYLAQLVKDVTIPKDESKITASDIAANAMAHIRKKELTERERKEILTDNNRYYPVWLEEMMATSIALSPYFEQFIREQIESGRYNNVSEVIRAGLRALEEREQQIKLDALRTAVELGVNSGKGKDAEVVFGRLSQKYRRMAEGDNEE
ncbi:type II toxin-antitoxin system ParD family antitoxin [Pectobacterium versatile]|uniref:type II toxin-antitoxin system ParD family antitoxin n=2 Tax=Pectobacterium versatile TaxID=2488639 RepID=UPI0027404E08|nr:MULTISPECIES: type II toxin-antitoxin system ParD family antitoxin [Pectobacterium]